MPKVKEQESVEEEDEEEVIEEEPHIIKSRSIIAKKKFIFSNLTKLWDTIKNAQLSEVEAESFLHSCGKYEASYDKVLEEIFEVNEYLEEKEKINLNDHSTFAGLIDKINKKCIGVRLEHQKVSKSAASQFASNTSEVKNDGTLPKLKVPIFDGNISDWSEFKAQFETIIHIRNISNVLKLTYLRNNLKGEPLAIVNQYPIGEQSYEQAWSDLKNRYDSKRRLGSFHLFKILNFKSAGFSKEQEHTEFIKSHRAATSALKNLGVDDLADFIMFELSYNNLALSDQKLFDREHDYTANMPTVKQLLDFMEKIAKSDEMRSDKFSSNKEKRETFVKPKMIPPVKKSFVTTKRSVKCTLCKLDHQIYSCPKLLALSGPERFEKVRSLGCCVACLYTHENKPCTSKYACKICNSRAHNTILHIDQSSKISESSKSSKESKTPPEQDGPTTTSAVSNAICNTCTISEPTMCQVILGTIQCRIKDNWNDLITIRALIDPGSEISIITTALADRLGLPRKSATCQVQGISQNVAKPLGNVQVEIQDIKSSFSHQLEAVILPSICGQIPKNSLSMDVVNKFKMLELADSKFYQPGNIQLLIGADVFSDILSSEEPAIIPGQPSAIRTKFGYVIIGKSSESSLNEKTVVSMHLTTLPLDAAITRFWESEEVSYRPEEDPADLACEEHFQKTHTRDKEGRFVVQLPFLPEVPSLGSNEQIATNRFYRLEWRLQRNETLANQYQNCLQEYIDLDHMSPCSKRVTYLLPHHAVIKESSSTTKLRVVFDCSCIDDKGYSLNDRLYRGAPLLSDISSLLINFRFHKVCIVCDVKMMYRMVVIAPEHRPYLVILWRAAGEPDRIIQYQMNRLTFGLKPAGYLAGRCIKELANLHKREFPLAARAIIEDRYADDFCSGAENAEQAGELQRQLTQLLSKGGFEIRRWSSNCPEALSEVSTEFMETPVTLPTGEVGVKVLGVMWEQTTDSFIVRVVPFKSETITKRTILSYIAKIYDVMGLFSPVIFLAKYFLQKLWLVKLDWDDPIEPSLAEEWTTFATDLTTLSDIKVPRFVPARYATVRLVGFADASERGMGSCAYIHLTFLDGHCESHLIKAKSKLAPLKTVTIPRLELCAALLLAQLIKSIADGSQLQFESIHLFSDSTIFLAWLQRPLHELKIFVSNRVSQIKQLTPNAQWGHVDSSNNPADLSSRGLLASNLKNAEIWWKGPPFLQQGHDFWPDQNMTLPSEENLPEIKEIAKVLTAQSENCESEKENADAYLYRFSSFSRMQRVLSYVRRFLHNFFYHKKQPEKCISGPLSTQELESTVMKAVEISQLQYFQNEMKTLKNKKSLERKNPLSKLSPFIDKQSGLLRVGGRLSRATFLPEATRHPLLLSKKCHLSSLIVDYYHKLLLHSGPRTTCFNIQKKFWILASSSLVKKITAKCIKCHRLNSKPMQPIMSDVLPDRLDKSYCWASCAIDFGGPFTTRESNVRKSTMHKSYICVFVCMTTRAIHIEMVTNLTAEAFIAAFHRFIARRSVPNVIYSDRGSNFVATRSILRECRDFILSNQEEIFTAAAAVGTRWILNAPYGGNFNTCAENGIKSCKSLLKRQVGDQILTFEEFSTLLCRIEQVLNSRPISFNSANINDQDVMYLTPGHFILGREMMTVPELPINENVTPLERWKRVQQMSQSFWKTWSTAYLHELMQRHKWTKKGINLKPGDLVYITGIGTSPLSWPIGRIEDVFTRQDDDTVRVAKIFSRGHHYVRPVNKLVFIPTSA